MGTSEECSGQLHERRTATMYAATVAVTVMMLVGCMRPAYGQEKDSEGLLHAPPFLEGTELFWTEGESPNSDGGLVKYLLEADIFPHFVAGFPSRCRRGAATRDWRGRPCISATLGVRLRMERGTESNPIYSPSFLPRINLQWLRYRKDGPLHGLTIQLGHHSNGQAGCLVTWTDTGPYPLEHWGKDVDPRKGYVTFLVPEPGDCADQGWLRSGDNSRDLAGTLNADTMNGNFSLNYVNIAYDIAGHPTNHKSRRWRVSVGVEVNGGIYEPLQGAYPRVRGRFLSSIGYPTNRRLCKRFDASVELIGGWSAADRAARPVEPDETDRHRRFVGAMDIQATCLWIPDLGFGWFARSSFGQDDYNSSFYSRDAFRFQIGFTINRLKTFGTD